MRLIQFLQERGGVAGMSGWDSGNDWSARGGWVENEETMKRSALVDFFMDNAHPTDTEVHRFAEDNNMDPEEVEERVYALVHELLNKLHGDANDEEEQY